MSENRQEKGGFLLDGFWIFCRLSQGFFTDFRGDVVSFGLSDGAFEVVIDMKWKKDRYELRPVLSVRPFGEPEFAPGEGALSKDRRLARAFEIVDLCDEVVERENAKQMLSAGLERLREERPTLTVGPAQKRVARWVREQFAYAPKRRGRSNGKQRGARDNRTGELPREAGRLKLRGLPLAKAKVAAFRWYRSRYPDAEHPKFRSRASIERSVRRIYRQNAPKKKMTTN